VDTLKTVSGWLIFFSIISIITLIAAFAFFDSDPMRVFIDAGRGRLLIIVVLLIITALSALLAVAIRVCSIIPLHRLFGKNCTMRRRIKPYVPLGTCGFPLLA